MGYYAEKTTPHATLKGGETCLLCAIEGLTVFMVGAECPRCGWRNGGGHEVEHECNDAEESAPLHSSVRAEFAHSATSKGGDVAQDALTAIAQANDDADVLGGRLDRIKSHLSAIRYRQALIAIEKLRVLGIKRILVFAVIDYAEREAKLAEIQEKYGATGSEDKSREVQFGD